jgi:hypothetical protein
LFTSASRRPEGLRRIVDQLGERGVVEQVALDHGAAVGALLVQVLGEAVGFAARAVAMQDHDARRRRAGCARSRRRCAAPLR